MVLEWPTRFLTFFHSHFLQFLSRAVLFLRLARDSFMKSWRDMLRIAETEVLQVRGEGL